MLCLEGAFATENNLGTWTVPTGVSCWVPAKLRHRVAPAPASRVRTLYISVRGSNAVARMDQIGVLKPSPLLRAIIDHIGRVEVLRTDDAAAKRLAGVLLDQLAQQHELPLFVPALASALSRRVAAALAADPADTPRATDLATELGVSTRTLERAFVTDAKMTLGEWRQRSRITRAITLLAGGSDVKDVALEVGYATPSAFVTAFKKYVGMTPGKI
jgi:AraC-like DNA-binding protein